MWPKTQRHRLWTRRACSSSSSPWGSPSFSASSPRIRSLALPQNRLSILCDCWYASEYILYQIDYQNCNCVWYKCTEHSSCNFALETLKWEILLKCFEDDFYPNVINWPPVNVKWMEGERESILIMIGHSVKWAQQYAPSSRRSSITHVQWCT